MRHVPMHEEVVPDLQHLAARNKLCQIFVTVKQAIKVGALGPSAPSSFRVRMMLSAGRITGARRTYLSDLAKHQLNGYRFSSGNPCRASLYRKVMTRTSIGKFSKKAENVNSESTSGFAPGPRRRLHRLVAAATAAPTGTRQSRASGE